MTEQPNVETQAWREQVGEGTFEFLRQYADRLDRNGYPVHAQEIRKLVAAFDALTAQIERYEDFLTRHDEVFRLIAEATGADGTAPYDWQALTAKADTALQDVRELRKDYDEATAAERDLASSQQAALLLHKRVEELETALAAAIAEVEGWGLQSMSSTRLREHLREHLVAALAARPAPLARDPEWKQQVC